MRALDVDAFAGGEEGGDGLKMQAPLLTRYNQMKAKTSRKTNRLRVGPSQIHGAGVFSCEPIQPVSVTECATYACVCVFLRNVYVCVLVTRKRR